MVRCSLGKPPTNFQRDVRTPGLTWLKKNPKANRGKKKLPRYWTRVLDDLAERFDYRCAYLAQELGTVGTVDHFQSVHEDEDQAYTWKNYRHAAGWLNSKKQALPSSQLLDPCVVRKGWFELHYPSLHLQVSSKCPNKYRDKAQFTIEKLELVRFKRVVNFRARRLQQYLTGGMDLPLLRRLAPLVAEMVEREGIVPARPKKTAPRTMAVQLANRTAKAKPARTKPTKNR